MVAQLLRAEARRWSADEQSEDDIAARAHATLALAGQACASAGLDPLTVVETDLAELKSRPHLAPSFSAAVDRLRSDRQDDMQDELSP